MLPPLLGYNDHDARKCRHPAYSLGARVGPIGKSWGPGPGAYSIEKNFTRYGKNGIPSYTLRPRAVINSRVQIPGPGAHSPEQCPPMHQPRAPMYSMSSRTAPRTTTIQPGPNAYTLPSCVGTNLVFKPSGPAYSLGSRECGMKGFSTPSPAQYGPTDPSVVKRKYPQYSMSSRQFAISDRTPRPGPGAYYPTCVLTRSAPGYSFGVRHSPYMNPLILECDN